MEHAADDYKMIADRLKDLGYRAYTGLAQKPEPEAKKDPPVPDTIKHTEYDGWC